MTYQPDTGEQATRIDSAEAAHQAAGQLAQQFRRGAGERDRQRQLPVDELRTLFRSGLGAVTVPRAYGGIALPTAELAKLMTSLSEADASIGQVPQNHFYALEVLRVNGSEAQKQRLYAEVLAGAHFGNALAEFQAPAAHQRTTRVYRQQGNWLLEGRKFYATGALFADRIPTAAYNEQGSEQLVFVPRRAAGVQVIDDWSGFGQRTTGSGTVIFERCNVDEQDIVPFQAAFDRPTAVGPFAQILHAAIDQGIARAAFQDLLAFVRERSRPWPDAGVEKAGDDPLTLDRLGRLAARLQAGEALLALAGDAVDAAQQHSDAETVAVASVEVAKARAWTTELSLAAANLLFELSGTRATLQEYQLDRHWRNARTHTLHDPVRWKFPAIGNYVLNGVLPARRGTL